jgi:hypothetical protein
MQFEIIYYINNWAVNNRFIPLVLLLIVISIRFLLTSIVFYIFFNKELKRHSQNLKIHSL